MAESSKKSVVSLFSGALGMDLGFELQGDFEILACVEREQAACATIRANVESGNFAGKPKVYCRDIFEFSPEQLMGTSKNCSDLAAGIEGRGHSAAEV